MQFNDEFVAGQKPARSDVINLVYFDLVISIWSLRFLGGFRRARDAPGIVFFLRFGDAFERGLVSLVVHFRLAILLRLLLVALLTSSPLGMHGHRKQRQNERRNREGLHRPALCAIRPTPPTLHRNDGNPGIGIRGRIAGPDAGFSKS